jgi:hypothetical protein
VVAGGWFCYRDLALSARLVTYLGLVSHSFFMGWCITSGSFIQGVNFRGLLCFVGGGKCIRSCATILARVLDRGKTAPGGGCGSRTPPGTYLLSKRAGSAPVRLYILRQCDSKYINVLTSMTSLTVGRRTGRVPVCDTCTCVRVVIHIAVARDSDSRRQRRL